MLLDKQLDYLLFERNVPFKFEKAAHMNVQIVGMPSSSSLEDRVRKLLKTFEAQFGSKFEEIVDREQDLRSSLGNDPTKHFFYLEVPGMKTARGRQRLRFYTVIGEGSRFDMQFGRVLACHLMNERDKINWKNCILERPREEELAKKFLKEIEARAKANAVKTD